MDAEKAILSVVFFTAVRAKRGRQCSPAPHACIISIKKQACFLDISLFCPQASKKRRKPHHIHQIPAAVTDIGRKPPAAVTDIGRKPPAAVTDIGRKPPADGGRARLLGEGAPACAPARGGRGAP